MNTFLEKYNETKAYFEENLRNYLDGFNYYPKLDEAMQYSLNAGGKRLRPVLMIECAKIIGLETEKVMPLATAIELIHTYSLIHDDLPCMDDDDLRRGKPTNHKVFGEDVAVLAGDGLLNLSMELALANAPKENIENYLNAVKLLFESSGPVGMIGGQVIDVNNTGKFQTLDDLKLMHSKKTGALFKASCLCPALILGCNDDIINCLHEYSLHLGLLFQITDDILDVVGDVENMGKTLGKDAASEKSTFISLMGLEESKAYATEVADKAKSSVEFFGEKSGFLKDLVSYIMERNN